MHWCCEEAQPCVPIYNYGNAFRCVVHDGPIARLARGLRRGLFAARAGRGEPAGLQFIYITKVLESV